MSRFSLRPRDLAVTVLLLVAAAFCLWQGLSGQGGVIDSDPAVTQVSHHPEAQSRIAPQAIETIRVGQRVAGSFTEGELAGETQVDAATWRCLRLRAESCWADGTLDVVNVVTLQPPEWMARYQADVGHWVPLPLDLVEMGLPEDMRAEVIANEPCPPIENGPGRVVLTTIDHLNSHVYELTISSPDGKSEKIRPTGNHKFYRPSDNAWVVTKDLSVGDSLQGPNGELFVHAIESVPGTHRVYNMTVEGEHVYRVATFGALVHNTCPTDPRRRHGYDPGAIHDDHPIARSLDGDPDVTRPFPAASNLRKGGLEGELRRYEEYLRKNTDFTEEQIRSVIQSEIDGLARDVIASPFSSVFPGGKLPDEL